MKMKPSLNEAKNAAVKIAKELHYDRDTVSRIRQAATEHEIARVLKQARLDQE